MSGIGNEAKGAGQHRTEIVGSASGQITATRKHQDSPIVSYVLYIIAALSTIGGVILSVALWPGDPSSGYRWLASAYVPSLTWLTCGIVTGVLFFAAGKAIAYLDIIAECLQGLSLKLTLTKQKDTDS